MPENTEIKRGIVAEFAEFTSTVRYIKKKRRDTTTARLHAYILIQSRQNLIDYITLTLLPLLPLPGSEKF